MTKFIIEIADDVTDEEALMKAMLTARQGKISVAPGNEGHMQYCYHTFFGCPGRHTGISVSATRLKSGTHKLYIRNDRGYPDDR
jgi:hypothetical protein